MIRGEIEMPNFVHKWRSTVLRRRQIVETLRKIIIKYGSEHVTVRKLAKEIGVSEGAIYRRFKSKREILLFLVEDIEEGLIGGIENAYPLKNPLDFLEEFSRNLLSSIQQRRGDSFLVIAEIISLGDKKVNRKIAFVLSTFLDRLKQVIVDGINAGEIRKSVDPEMAATFFFGMHQGLATNWALGGFPPTLQKESDSMCKLFLEGIKNG